MIRPVVVLGGRGDGVTIAETIRDAERAGMGIALYGFLDDGQPVGSLSYGGKPVLGRLDDWASLPPEVGFIPAIHKVKDMPARVARIEGLGIPEDRWIAVRHPLTVVAEDAEIGVGSFMASFVSVHAGAKVGRFASLRSSAVMGHDSTIGDHAYVGPNASLCGRAHMERGACLGPNAVLLTEKTMGEFSIAGIASAVTKDVPPYRIVFGAPAAKIGVQPRLEEA